MNGYVAFYRDKRIEVRAETLVEARDIAASLLGARKPHEVAVVLAEKPAPGGGWETVETSVT